MIMEEMIVTGNLNKEENLDLKATPIFGVAFLFTSRYLKIL